MTTPLSAAQRLGQRLDELDRVLEQLRLADLDAIEKRQTADVEESKEYLKAEGSIEARKHSARIACARLEFEAVAAEAHVRHLSRMVRRCEKRIDAGRTYSADLRAELATLGRDGAA